MRKDQRPGGLRLTIAGRSLAARLFRSAMSGVPQSISRLIRGPVTRIELGTAVPGKSRQFRPIDLVVPTQFVLRRRLSVPKAARGDLVHAVELFIGHNTPFEPSEVVAHAEEIEEAGAGEASTFVVRLLPRRVVEDAMARLRLRRWHIGRVILSETNLPDISADVATAFFARSPLRPWLVLIPVAVLLGSAGLLAGEQLSARQQQIDQLEMETTSILSAVKSLEAKLDTEAAASSGRSAALALVATTPSRFSTLETLRGLLPAATEVLEIHAHAGETRLSVRSPNVLTDAQSLGAANGSWTSAVDGAVTSDPTNRKELATIVLRTKPSGSS